VEKVLDGQSVASLARELGIGGKSDSCLEERLFTKWQWDSERRGNKRERGFAEAEPGA
jgi:hypothetical protein